MHQVDIDVIHEIQLWQKAHGKNKMVILANFWVSAHA